MVKNERCDETINYVHLMHMKDDEICSCMNYSRQPVSITCVVYR